MISYVTFFVDLDSDTLGEVRSLVPTVTKYRPEEFISTMFASARLQDPGCWCTVLTDQRTALDLAGDIEVFRCDIDRSQVMMARAVAYLEFLDCAEGDVVFLDSDMLVQGPLSEVFESPFDIGLTYRDDDHWPINTGIIFCHGERLDAARRWLRMALDSYRDSDADNKIWGAEQDAVASMLAGADFGRTDTFHHQTGGFDVLLLPASIYNYSSEENRPMVGPYKREQVLHFKGLRHAQMMEYWERQLAPASVDGNRGGMLEGLRRRVATLAGRA